jgi:hypothetical protein
VFLNSVRKKLATLLTSFVPRQFLERIVAADEIWVHHYESETKTHSMAWKHPISPVAKKFKSQPSTGKIMLTLFWNMEVAVLVHFTPKISTCLAQ